VTLRPAKFGPERQMSRIFSSHKNMNFLAMRTNGLKSTQWEKTSIAPGTT
jgi:hypothetical protein